MTIQSKTPTLIDGTLRLRAPQMSDVQARFDLGRTPEIEHMFGMDPEKVTPMTMDEAGNWVKYHVETTNSWFVDIGEKFVGCVFLHTLNKTDQRAMLAVSLFDQTCLGQGYGTRAMRLVLEHAFKNMGLHRIGLRVIEYNQRARASYKKLGFVEEGRERESGFVAGKRYDDIMMGLLKTEFEVLQ